MYEVHVEARFTASHAVRLPSGQMEALHAHDWGVKITFAGEQLDSAGLLVDFLVVQERLQRILQQLDGANLNEHGFLDGLPASAENVAGQLFDRMALDDWGMAQLRRVAVSEAPDVPRVSTFLSEVRTRSVAVHHFLRRGSAGAVPGPPIDDGPQVA